MTNEKVITFIVKEFLGDISKSEAHQLSRWRKSADANQKLYTDLQAIWQGAPSKFPPSIPDVTKQWCKLSTALDFKSQVPEKSTPVQAADLKSSVISRGLLLTLAIAATVFIITAFFVKSLKPPPPPAPPAVISTMQEQESIFLSDGSTIRLNAGSTIEYQKNFSPSKREILFKGEGLFDIRKEGRPFIIHTENASIRVLGTTFNIWARNNETRVIVAAGQVSLKPLQGKPNNQVLITRNELATCIADNTPSRPVTIDAIRRLGWLQDKLVFIKTPLSEAVEELQRLFDVKIKLQDENLNVKTVTITLGRTTIEQTLDAICTKIKLKYTLTNGVYRIQQKA